VKALPTTEALSIERRTSRDDDEIARLYGDVFGSALAESNRRRWRWQYLDNPNVGPEGSEIWIAREGERILGQYASMPVRLWWKNREARASWGMDVFVRQEARGRGVGARLFTAWADHVDVALGLGLTPSSYGLFRKLGYADVGPVPLFQKVLAPRPIVERRLGPGLGRIVTPLAGLILRARFQERPVVPSSGQPAVEVRSIATFTPEYDDLWERTRGSYMMCARRDAAYLNWKYRDCPHRSYDLWEARLDQRLVGFAVSRHEIHRGLELGWLVDLFADASDVSARDALLGAILGSFREAGVARAQAFSLGAPLATSLRRRGFFPARSPMQFCVRAKDQADEVIADTGSWHVVFGDSDMDR
jgi:GNAT superfamily N-acetyltransferase